MSLRFFISAFLIVLSTLNAGAQIYTTNFTSVEQDSYVTNAYADSSFGTNKYLNVHHTAATSETQRFFLEFDLSSIPANAIVTEATLTLYADSVTGSSNLDLYVERLDSLWYEDSITWNNQTSAYFSDQISIANSVTSSTGSQDFDVMDHVEHFVRYGHLNTGWLVRLQNDTVSTDYGVRYASSNHDTTSWRPALEVKYILPPEMNVNVTHCTNGNADGETDITVSGGSGGAINYYWFYRQNSNGSLTLYKHGSSPSFDDMESDTLSPNLYLLIYRDSLWAHEANDPKFKHYKYFIVGEEGETTEISWWRYSDIYHNDAGIVQNTQTSNAPNWSDNNNDSQHHIGTGYSKPISTSGYDYGGLIGYNVDFDASLDYDTVQLRFSEHSYYRSNGGSNAVDFMKVTSWWDDRYVTWNIRPTVDSTVMSTLPQTEPWGNGNGPDTVDVLSSIVFWQENPDENFGLYFQVPFGQSTNNSRFFRGGLFGNPVGPQLRLKFTVKPTLTVNFVDSLNRGTIDVVSPAGELPYTYLISTDSIPSMDTIWYALKDSIPVDSASFYRGRTSSRLKTFNDLPPNHYHIAVFDNSGTRILYEEADVTREFELFEYVQISEDYDTVKVSSGNTWGSATFGLQLSKYRDGGFDTKLYTLGETIIGLNTVSDDNCTKAADFELGFKLDSLGVYEILKSNLVVYSDTLDTLEVGDRIRIYKENNTYKFYKNRILLHSEELTITEVSDFKAEVLFMQNKGVVSFPMAVAEVAVAEPISFSIDHPECELDNGTVTVSAIGWSYWNQSNISVDIYDAEGDTSVLQNPITALPYTQALSSGDYYFYYTWDAGSNSYSLITPFTIDYPIIWNLQDQYYTPHLGTVNTISNNTTDQFATATSLNTLPKDTDGWVSFNVDQSKFFVDWNNSYNKQIVYAKLSVLDDNNDPNIDVHVYPLSNGSLNKFVYVTKGDSSTSLGYQEIYGNGPIKIDLSSGTFNVYLDNGTTSLASVSEGTSTTHTARSESVNSYIHDSYASFCYGLTTSEICGELDYELNGNYYVTNSGKFCFVFDQEYNDTTITFNLYNISNDIVATQDDFNIQNMIHGENRIVLDLFAVDCACSGFFVLEVINAKGERKYLRYYSDMSGNCFIANDCYVAPGDGASQ